MHHQSRLTETHKQDQGQITEEALEISIIQSIYISSQIHFITDPPKFFLPTSTNTQNPTQIRKHQSKTNEREGLSDEFKFVFN